MLSCDFFGEFSLDSCAYIILYSKGINLLARFGWTMGCRPTPYFETEYDKLFIRQWIGLPAMLNHRIPSV